MTSHFLIVLCLIVLICMTNILSQCTNCQESTPWNFNLQINYDSYVWDCSSSTIDPTQKYTNISCLLDGRWSIDHLTFKLQSIPSNELKSIPAEYTMKNNVTQKVSFESDLQWALTLPVDKNEKQGIYDKIQFNYGGFNYTYYFGYGPYPHCPRC